MKIFMSANTIVYVKVTKIVTEIVEVSALTLDDAKEQASEIPSVHLVLGASYDRESLENDDF
jgi:hypothetical protein